MLPVTDAAATSKYIWMKHRNMLTDDCELCSFFLTNHFIFQFEVKVISLDNEFQCVSLNSHKVKEFYGLTPQC